uniref:hypothetical protein n=1 Tax=Vibrio harveyi group TaxID=717610 RepID=UPI003CC69A71
MKTVYPINAFSAEQVLNIVNSELETTNLRVRAVSLVKHFDGTCCVFRTNTKKRLLVQFVTFGGLSQVRVRAIHRIKNTFASYSYLPNGQGGRNLETLIFNGEQGDAYSVTEAEFRTFLKESFCPTADTDYVEKRVEMEFPKAA